MKISIASALLQCTVATIPLRVHMPHDATSEILVKNCLQPLEMRISQAKTGIFTYDVNMRSPPCMASLQLVSTPGANQSTVTNGNIRPSSLSVL